jgi:hypothetical protein
MHWPTFWAAIEALATAGTLLIALVILFWELPKFRKEMAARKVEGLKFASEQLETRHFKDCSRLIIDAWKSREDDIPQGIYSYVTDAISSIDFVARLIKLEYIDKDLFFYIYAENLVLIERAFTNFGSRREIFTPSLKAYYPDGYSLLKEAAKYVSKEREEELERLEM